MEVRTTILKGKREQLAALVEEYQVITTQLNETLAADDRQRLARRLTNLEPAMQRLAQEIERLEAEARPEEQSGQLENYQLLQAKLTELERALILETSAAVKFQLKHQIAETRRQRDELGRALGLQS